MGNSFGGAVNFVDLDRYPIDHDCQARRDLLTSAQALIKADGSAVLKGFIKPEKIGELEDWKLLFAGDRHF
ncbi:MAG: hypothetical protein O3A62_01985 [Actinomycetota bacterium]|nr:hypothetical protein [Actinomycetota bacterium]